MRGDARIPGVRVVDMEERDAETRVEIGRAPTEGLCPRCVGAGELKGSAVVDLGEHSAMGHVRISKSS